LPNPNLKTPFNFSLKAIEVAVVFFEQQFLGASLFSVSTYSKSLNKNCRTPAKNAEKNAATGLIIVIGKSISAYVMEIESTPDSGVEIKNAEVAPLEAPLFLSVTAVGITEHEHKGRGTPIIEALKTDEKESFPSHFLTLLIGTN
jgi:hypothetical protein